MNQLLSIGQKLYTESSYNYYTIDKFLGSGGQGEVYQAHSGNHIVALKWYFSHCIRNEINLRQRLTKAIEFGSPNNRFLWPIDVVLSHQNVEGFGYIMPLREASYTSINDLMKGRVEISFRALITAGIQLTDSFLQLHAKGLCYKDISFVNIFLNPDNGNILICDNDNVTIDGDKVGNILGTLRFMAPEIVRREELPCTNTDLYSLSVLLFYMLTISHPLEGLQESKIRCFDINAQEKIYGSEPVFIFDPDNVNNRPVQGIHDNVLIFWHIYPQFLRDLFIKAFTEGLKKSKHSRVTESIWRANMVRLRDSILYCSHCGAENFYDSNVIKSSDNNLIACWSCKEPAPIPVQIHIGQNIIMLNHDTQLFPHHIDDNKLYEFSQPVAEVTQHPHKSNIWGLKNLSEIQWITTTNEDKINHVDPGRSIILSAGLKINFGNSLGEICLGK
ncbi:MAG: protein kinase [Cyanobacteria bacterium P01_A01_bin.68]